MNTSSRSLLLARLDAMFISTLMDFCKLKLVALTISLALSGEENGNPLGLLIPQPLP
jgi:hypothetical protein